MRSKRSTRNPTESTAERARAASGDGGRSSRAASRNSASRSPVRDHSPSTAGYSSSASGERSQREYRSPAELGAGGGVGLAASSSPNRSSFARATASPSRPKRCASRIASEIRPSTAAPQVTSAAAVPATVAIPPSAQRRGAGTITPASAGSHTKVYHPGHAPYGCHSHKPAAPASTAHAQAVGIVHGTRRGSASPRTSAAPSSTSAMLTRARAAFQESHKPH